MIRVAIADDQALVRGAFALLLRSDPRVELVGEAADGVEAVALARREQPDVMLMDVRMPRLDGVEATRRIVGLPGNRTRVLILTTFDLDEYVFGALRAGAAGFLVKDVEPEGLLRAIEVVAAGESLLAPRATTRLIEEYLARGHAHQGPPPPGLVDLTAREREVLAAVGRGRTNAEIARELFITYATAKSHVSHLLTKCDARDRTQLVILAHEFGLLG
ncbi:MAG: response regulator transcription factor [Tessaracoccus sp.]|uniref:response regulator n=1 Tax=Tessaracoccus sp. TaxID=1971211 RepID=UPI001ECF5F76|nr:response regulator transcription factor [Tessaracoccus sp.]MBK7820026.1 response regulator transcription factor [Tessaracoccus sp.]